MNTLNKKMDSVITVQQVADTLRGIPFNFETTKAVLAYHYAYGHRGNGSARASRDDLNPIKSAVEWDELKRIKSVVDFLVDNKCGHLDYDAARSNGVIPSTPYKDLLPGHAVFEGRYIAIYIEWVQSAIDGYKWVQSVIDGYNFLKEQEHKKMNPLLLQE